MRSSGPFVTRTQIAGRIVRRAVLRGDVFYFPLPGALGAVWRNQNPFAGQNIVAGMGVFVEIEGGLHTVCVKNGVSAFPQRWFDRAHKDDFLLGYSPNARLPFRAFQQK